MNVDLIGPSSNHWERLLASAPHDFYSLPGYAELCARYEGASAIALHGSDGTTEFLLPLLLRALPPSLDAEGLRDAASPYGYPGVIWRGDEGRFGDFLGSVRAVAADSGIVSIFVRLHPLIRTPSAPVRHGLEFRTVGETVYSELQGALGTIAGVRKGYRYDVRKLTNAGYSVVFDNWAVWSEFGEVYRETMSRLSASSYYLFPDWYFDSLRETLGSRLHLVTVHGPEGDMAAGALITAVGGIVQYHLSGTANAHMKAAPAKLLLMETMRWADQNGNRVVHLGGGVGGRDDSLFQFKAGFARGRGHFRVMRHVCLPDDYTTLCARSGNPADADFFPAYRAPAK